jgi:hypothetical protein
VTLRNSEQTLSASGQDMDVTKKMQLFVLTENSMRKKNAQKKGFKADPGEQQWHLPNSQRSSCFATSATNAKVLCLQRTAAAEATR